MAMRYDLPDPPDSDLAADIAADAPSVLTSHHLTCLGLVGPSPAVTPVVDPIRAAAAQAGLALHEVLRVAGWPATGRTCARRSPGVQAN